MFSFPVAAVAGIYRWVDENGQVHFGNIPPKHQKEYRSGYENFSTNNKTVNKKGGKTENIKGKKSPGSKKETQNDKTQSVKKKRNSNNISAGKTKEKRAKHTKDKKANIKSKKTTKKRVSENTNDADSAKAAGMKENTKLDDLLKSLHDQDNHIDKNSKNRKVEERKTNNPQNSSAKKISQDEKVDLKNNRSKRELSDNKQPDKKHTKVKNEDEVKNKAKGVKSKIESKIAPSSNSKKSQEEKCGFFSGYVDTYQYRIKYECPGEHCDLLRKELEKYKKKAALYCNN